MRERFVDFWFQKWPIPRKKRNNNIKIKATSNRYCHIDTNRRIDRRSVVAKKNFRLFPQNHLFLNTINLRNLSNFFDLEILNGSWNLDNWGSPETIISPKHKPLGLDELGSVLVVSIGCSVSVFLSLVVVSASLFDVLLPSSWPGFGALVLSAWFVSVLVQGAGGSLPRGEDTVELACCICHE